MSYKKFIVGFGFLLAVGLTVPAGSFAQESDADLLNAVDMGRGDTFGISWHIDVVSNEGGKSVSNGLDVKNRGGSFLAEYSSPRSMRGQKLLRSGRNMWFIKPNVSKPVPISPRQRLLGAASYGDLASTTFATSYTPSRLDDQKVGGVSCHVFDLVAREEGETYDRVQLWVSKASHLGIKAEYYSIEGKLLKTATFEHDNKVKRPGDKHPNMISKMTITDGSGEETTLTYSKVKVKGVSWDTFDVSTVIE